MTKKESTPKRAKGGGGKLSRSEIVQTRLSPKLRFIAEIMARHQRRTLSSLIEGLIEEAAERYTVTYTWTEPEMCMFRDKQYQRVPVLEAVNRVWSIEDADKFAAFAIHLPDLLTPEEERIWQVICDTPYFWLYFDMNEDIEYPTKELLFPLLDAHGLIRERLREHWPLLQVILEGKEPIEKFKALKLGKGLPAPESDALKIVRGRNKQRTAKEGTKNVN